jgi:DNA-directed RNA polymerase III subunit RPC8
MVVFRPFRGEILYAHIKSSTPEGITLEVQFHNEIFVPHQNLPPDCDFDQSESTWIWRPGGGQEYFFDKGEPVLFRVEQEEWFDQKPSIQQKDEQGNPIDTRGTAWRIIVSGFDLS